MHEHMIKKAVQIVCIGTLCLSSSLHSIDSLQYPMLNQAERLFEEKLYLDAYPLYEAALAEMSDRQNATFMNIAIRLAHCYLEIKEHQKIISLFEQYIFPDALNEEDLRIRYLLALAYRHTNQHALASQALQVFEHEPYQSLLKDEHKLELGIHAFYQYEYPKALSILQSIHEQKASPELYYLAQLYLTRIHLIEKNISAASQRLQQLESLIPKTHLLHYERSYLMGMAAFEEKDYAKALKHFQDALPLENISHCPWLIETLHHIYSSCMKQVDHSAGSKEELAVLFQKAEDALKRVLILSYDEQLYLKLGELYTSWAITLNDQQAFERANELLSIEHLLTNENARILLIAAANPNYHKRISLYQKLIQMEPSASIIHAQAWYWKGMNEYKQGLLLKTDDAASSQLLLTTAAESLGHAASLLKHQDFVKGFQALKYQALAKHQLLNHLEKKQAWDILLDLTKQPELLNTSLEPEEVYYTTALIGMELLGEKETLVTSQEIENILNIGLEKSKNSAWHERILKIAGLFYFKDRQFAQAEDHFKSFISLYPVSPSCGEVYFWRAACADQLQNQEHKQEYLQKTYTTYPTSPYAPLAYFHLYSYKEYMLGHRKAIKHLQAMDQHFPHHPLLITTYYLLGMDHKKDRLSKEGKVHQHKDLIASIDRFQQAEDLFDQLYTKHSISNEDLMQSVQIRYQAQLERALANFMIAQTSIGSKKRIYLNYAIEVFEHIRSAFTIQKTPVNLLMQDSSYPRIWQEADYQLAKAYSENNQSDKADELFNEMLQHYAQVHLSNAYFLSRTWYEKGKLAQKQEQYEQALTFLQKAELAYNHLSSDEKLDLWIEQSNCLKELKQYEQAMQLLSKAVNEESFSSLRIKAMFLRAEIYSLEGKPELAIKQLEATSKKGGEWGLKAKEALNVRMTQNSG